VLQNTNHITLDDPKVHGHVKKSENPVPDELFIILFEEFSIPGGWVKLRGVIRGLGFTGYGFSH